MTSAQLRQSFLDFFREREHTLVPSSSLRPDSPNLLFTNAGMNQFVPIFLGERSADVSGWPGAVPGSDRRAADTQKCIRAGGKHNDLEDVGFDTYHHTFFEMLGNWSFGDYFKKEAIAWAWELVVERWGFPPARLYATIYQPGAGDPAERDEEAWDHWAEKFRAAGLDPAVHIVNGNKKDNFWMMGETGPCGPCSELHVDLTPLGDTAGRLVNQGSADCIEIWNLVFIQFNANPDGSFTPLPAQHVDTGMGFERVASIIQGTKGFTDFAHAKISNYETDVFRPIFDELERMSGKRYGSTLPQAGTELSEQEKIDVAFRVIADHIRTLSFAIADGIQPGNSDRQYVLRRILRRAVRYGRALGFTQPFFYKLTAVLAQTMGEVFPEIRKRQSFVEETLRREEESFNRTLDDGVKYLEDYLSAVPRAVGIIDEIKSQPLHLHDTDPIDRVSDDLENDRLAMYLVVAGLTSCSPLILPEEEFRNNPVKVAVHLFNLGRLPNDDLDQVRHQIFTLPGALAFKLYDTYGFPLDLTELLARERGLTVDVAGFEPLMAEQRARARAAQKRQVIELSQLETHTPTRFVGYETLAAQATVQEVVALKEGRAVVLDVSPAYAEMGGQIGDAGELSGAGQLWSFSGTRKSGATFLHLLRGDEEAPAPGTPVEIQVEAGRRHAIERHHTATHLLHWALHEVVSHEATQKGSAVAPEKLTFDFNAQALTPGQLRDVERLVNERIVENAAVTWQEVPYAGVQGRADIMQAFGDKYGDRVRVVQIGGAAAALDGYSMELCGGTHTRHTGELGLFRIVTEGAIAAGQRRIEAVAGLAAYGAAAGDAERLKMLAGQLGAPLGELEKKLEALLARQKELEKQLESLRKKGAAALAAGLTVEQIAGTPAIIHHEEGAGGEELQTLADALKASAFEGVVFLAGNAGGQAALLASVSPAFTAKFPAGKMIQAIAPLLGGKGGGRPDSARGAGREVGRIPEALAQARLILQQQA